MTSRQLIDLMERQDAARAGQYEAEARAVLQAWLDKVKKLWPRLFPMGRNKQPFEAYELSEALRSLSGIQYGSTYFLFSGRSGGTKGLFTPKEHNKYRIGTGDGDVVNVYNDVFSELHVIPEAAYLQQNEYANPQRKREARNEANAYLQRLEQVLFTPEVIDTFVHEMTHDRDNEHTSLAGKLDRTNAAMNQKIARKKLTKGDLDRAYMGSEQEYNGYFTHAYGAAVRLAPLNQPDRRPTFAQFRDIFMRFFGQNHWNDMPAERQRKALVRLYTAYHDAVGQPT